jgi:hypothetical protein
VDYPETQSIPFEIFVPEIVVPLHFLRTPPARIELEPGTTSETFYLLISSFAFTVEIELGDASKFTTYSVAGGMIIFTFTVPK